MQKFVASALGVAVTAKSFPYKKDQIFVPVPQGTIGATSGYWMGMILSINQDSKDTPLTFAWATGIYPASNKFDAGAVYQTYVQAAGMSLAGTYSNAVCNMVYSPTAPTFTAANSCGNTMLSNITTKVFTGVTGEDTTCYNPWTSYTGY
jgi:hypothetical protein